MFSQEYITTFRSFLSPSAIGNCSHQEKSLITLSALPKEISFQMWELPASHVEHWSWVFRSCRQHSDLKHSVVGTEDECWGQKTHNSQSTVWIGPHYSAWLQLPNYASVKSLGIWSKPPVAVGTWFGLYILAGMVTIYSTLFCKSTACVSSSI